MAIHQPDYDLPSEYLQLALDLDLPEVEGDGITPEMARVRSEAALAVLRSRRGTNTAPAWLDTFFELLDGGWPWRQATYIAWASTPTEGRLPKTQDELARDYLGLTSDRAISTWRKRNPAILETIAVLQAAPLWEQRADHFRALNEGASQAGKDYKFFNHLKLAMEMRKDYIPAAQAAIELTRKGGTDDLTHLSDAELAARAKSLNGQDEEAGE